MSGRDHRRFYPHDVDLVSIDSSNQTQSDLPGPGRNLGNFYSFLGRHLEGFFNGLAERRGLGPNAVAVRIRKRDELRRDRDRLGGYSRKLFEYTEEEATEQKKDLEKLINYSKSRTESTRQQALENMIDFALRDDHLRDLLKALNAVQVIRAEEPYIWDYCDPSVQISSRLALACVQEDRIFQLAQSLRHNSSSALERSSLAEYMRLNPEQSFLVLRLFTRCMRDLALDNILNEVEALAITSPEQVEWEEVDKLFEYWFAHCFCSRTFRWKSSFRPFWRICQSPEKLPRTIQSQYFQSWIRGLEDPTNIIPHVLLERLLRATAAERMSQDRAFNFLSPFTQALDEADVVLCGMTAPSIGEDIYYPAHTTMCTDTIDDGCAKLTKLIDSGDRWLAQRALVCCSVVLAMGIYPRTQMLKSLACTAFADSAEYVRLIDATGGKCRLRPSDENQACAHLKRRCDDQGHLTHIWSYGYCCTGASSFEQELYLDLGGVMDIEFKRGEPVTAPNGVVPILAGHYSDGRRALLCRRGHFMDYCAVPEGTKAEVNFTLCTLRYALDTYSRPHGPGDFAASGDQGSDATGPYSWKFVRYITRAEDGDRKDNWILDCDIVWTPLFPIMLP